MSYLVSIKFVQSQIIFTVNGQTRRRQYLFRKSMKSKLPVMSYPDMKLKGTFIPVKGGIKLG